MMQKTFRRNRMHRCSCLLRESRGDIIWIDTKKISACLTSGALYFACSPSCMGWHAKQKPHSKTEKEKVPRIPAAATSKQHPNNKGPAAVIKEDKWRFQQGIGVLSLAINTPLSITQNWDHWGKKDHRRARKYCPPICLHTALGTHF